MTARPKRAAPLPPPTMQERAAAADAARALRQAIADPRTMGSASTAHIDLSRPRRGVWHTTWSNLPGFVRWVEAGGLSYHHSLLPGWQYTRAEILPELIPDLDALAERGERPTEVTNSG